MRMDLFKECNNAFVRTEKETRVQEVEDYMHWAKSMLLMEE